MSTAAPTVQRPRVADVVHYITYGSPARLPDAPGVPDPCMAAVVVDVGDDDTVTLFVMNRNGDSYPVVRVGYLAEHDGRYHGRGTWHWPERD